jgi:hypothetical protein
MLARFERGHLQEFGIRIPIRLQERLVAGHRKLAVLSQEPTLDAGRVQDAK